METPSENNSNAQNGNMESREALAGSRPGDGRQLSPASSEALRVAAVSDSIARVQIKEKGCP